MQLNCGSVNCYDQGEIEYLTNMLGTFKYIKF